MDELLADFLTETNEALAECDTALVCLEQVPDDKATLAQIFRLVHTIKGTCGFLGLPRLEKVAHAGENLLGRFRDGAVAPTPARITLVLRVMDAVRLIVAGLEQGGAEPAGDDSALIAELNAACEGGEPKEAPAAAAAAPAEPALGEPALAEPAAPAPAAEAQAEVQQAEVQQAEVQMGDRSIANQTIRVHVDVLEDLMTLVSELVLTRNQLLQAARREENSLFTAPLQRLSQITSSLQEGVMKTRMQPIGNAWAKLPRLVRDLARDLGKRIELVQQGADTELDRQMLELIKDPITHMVRNSADHGLEAPEARRLAGKPEIGRITLHAYHDGGHIVIKIADDGKGLPVERIKAKALASGLATEDELASLTDEQIQQFVFRAGFSTAEKVTGVSGRGVGMDVVRTNIERIGGTIEIRSAAGKGSTFTIKIPLTLAITSALIVEVAGERFAIPQTGVVELVRTGGNADPTIELINGTPVLRLRERLLPLVGLRQLLGLATAEAPADAAGPHAGEAFVVVTQFGAHGFGIVVDRVFDIEEIVVKPVASILRHLTLFSGNTILGDGSVIMILDTNGIGRAMGLTSTDGVEADSEANEGAAERTELVLFRAGDGLPKAVPLGLVARLETISRGAIESSGGVLQTQYRHRLVPLIAMPGVDLQVDDLPVLVFADANRIMGLVVDRILDVVEEEVEIELDSATEGVLGTAVIAGRTTDMLDAAFWLRQAFGDWFGRSDAAGAPNGPRPRLLLVEDSRFFRDLLAPLLTAAGYDVVTAEHGVAALRLRDAGEMVDCIISDLEMPELDGFGLLREVRAGGAWAEVPAIALSGRTQPSDVAQGRAAGFTDHIAKFDREVLLSAIASALNPVQAFAA